jgi:high affinity cAMP-specific and IBMX-insensitive 3',5'-cyclic phosphodiesterase 8
MSPHLRHSPATPPPQQLQEALEGVDRWDYDIIHLERVCQEARRLGPLYYVGSKIFKDFNVSETLGVDETTTSCWLKLMETHYKSNPYHNSTHAADVLHAAAYLVKQLQDKLATHGEMLDQAEIAAICISAVVHDLDHPGFTNPFLCNSRAQLALLYNDKSVLENHHVSLAFRLTEDSENATANIFQSLDGATYREMRVSIIDMVLATDMSQHFEHLTKFNALMAQDTEAPGQGSAVSLTKEGQEARQVLKRILVKCADISNPLRPMHLCREWAERIAKEYFSQTDEEKSRDLPVVFPDFDRETCIIPNTQVPTISPLL